MDDLILKLRNLQVLLEEANNRGAHSEVRHLIAEIKQTVEEIELKRSVQGSDAANVSS